MGWSATELSVNDAFGADQSIALRYAAGVFGDLVETEQMVYCSRREGAQIVDLGTWRGVRLKLLDESSLMASGTYKSLDGCVSTAICRQNSVNRAVFSSGANAGSALSLYGAKTGLESFFFCPSGNIRKLDGAVFERPAVHLIAVDGADRRVKRAAALMAERLPAPIIPELEWRLRSAACRGLFIAENIISQGSKFDWFVQSICAGYGPLGIYRAFADLVDSGTLGNGQVPRLMGVQQAGLCPIVSAWENGCPSLPPMASGDWREEPIEPALYNVHPDKTYPELYTILKAYNGDAIAVCQDEFERFGPDFLDLLETAGMVLTRVNGQLLERAGLLAGAGVLKAIDTGRIAPGCAVLCALTGGMGKAPSKKAAPECRIGVKEDLEASIARLASQYAD